MPSSHLLPLILDWKVFRLQNLLLGNPSNMITLVSPNFLIWPFPLPTVSPYLPIYLPHLLLFHCHFSGFNMGYLGNSFDTKNPPSSKPSFPRDTPLVWSIEIFPCPCAQCFLFSHDIGLLIS